MLPSRPKRHRPRITGTCLKNPGPPDHDTFGAKARDHGSLKAHALKVVRRSLGKQLGDLITLAREFRGKHDVVSSLYGKGSGIILPHSFLSYEVLLLKRVPRQSYNGTWAPIQRISLRISRIRILSRCYSAMIVSEGNLYSFVRELYLYIPSITRS